MENDKDALCRGYLLRKLSDDHAQLAFIEIEFGGETALGIAEEMRQRYAALFHSPRLFKENQLLPLIAVKLRELIAYHIGEEIIGGDEDWSDERFYYSELSLQSTADDGPSPFTDSLDITWNEFAGEGEHYDKDLKDKDEDEPDSPPLDPLRN